MKQTGIIYSCRLEQPGGDVSTLEFPSEILHTEGKAQVLPVPPKQVVNDFDSSLNTANNEFTGRDMVHDYVMQDAVPLSDDRAIQSGRTNFDYPNFIAAFKKTPSVSSWDELNADISGHKNEERKSREVVVDHRANSYSDNASKKVVSTTQGGRDFENNYLRNRNYEQRAQDLGLLNPNGKNKLNSDKDTLKSKSLHKKLNSKDKKKSKLSLAGSKKPKKIETDKNLEKRKLKKDQVKRYKKENSEGRIFSFGFLSDFFRWFFGMDVLLRLVIAAVAGIIFFGFMFTQMGLLAGL
ncbi:MAG: hypothetical protein UT61_C0053G0010 [Candidatus Woesebacteria bacterium GW2011_GWA1_39_8]|uniref:Uncharacterized protein n=1 Tax=Candidatus Woesebacteria bacterium GW2011_GWA1_39_8 TaxID=1618552 RepID=A0A0G0PJA2_9BACT|nr:MAG: hypothetical protein UT61_C0053G0010 [Candidatus Woesebacteria bacterium GW2011_GWA1_39_8]